MRKLILIGTILLSFITEAQIDTDADFKRVVYKDEYTIGLMLHTRSPWPALSFRRLHYTDGYTKWGYEINYTSYRHPREIKYPTQSFFGSSQSYSWDKINDFLAFRVGYGREKVLYDKTDQGSVSISLQTYGGIDIGLLKPIYVDIEENDREYSVRYDPTIHDNIVQIKGESPFFTGFDETKLRLGVYGKVGASFDYNFFDQKITSIETGVIIDYYPSWFGLYEEGGVPVMGTVDNLSLWWQVYVSFNFGNKWF